MVCMCECECVSTKCVDSHVQSSPLCSSKCVQLRQSARACGFAVRGSVVQMRAHDDLPVRVSLGQR